MKKTGSYLSATALGSFTAVAALLVGLSGANAQAPAPTTPLAGAGSFPGSFIVPGTNTSLHVGGVIQVDTTWDFDTVGNGASNGAQQNETPQNISLTGGNGIGGAQGSAATGANAHESHGVFRINPNATHPFFETRTPTPYGELKTYWEIDFAGTYSSSNASPTSGNTTIGTNCCSNTSTPRLKQAYGTLGPWLIGMTNSNFADLDSLADTTDAFVEAGAFMSAGTAKEPQFRYTYLLPNGISLSGSVEEAQSAGIFASTVTGTTVSDWNNFNSSSFGQKIPAFTGKARIDQPWGHAAFGVAVMQERMQNQVTTNGVVVNALPVAGADPFLPTTAAVPGANIIAPGAHADRWGYQLLQSGHFNTWGADKITWNIGYGQGAAQYSGALSLPDLGGQFEEGLVCSASVAALAGSGGSPYDCHQPTVFGVNAGYSHWWTSEWRSAVAFGWDTDSNPMRGWADGGTGMSQLERRHMNANANVQWTPVPQVQFAMEFRWYQRVVWSGAHGTHEMIDFQTLFKF
jgi:Porin subfamily